MSFDDTSKDIWLEHGHILHASCKDNQGDYVDSQIDLDLYIGNDDGQFLWGGSDFSKTAHHIHLSGGIVLEAKLKKEDGSWSDLQGINLRDHISNQDGKLTYD